MQLAAFTFQLTWIGWMGGKSREKKYVSLIKSQKQKVMQFDVIHFMATIEYSPTLIITLLCRRVLPRSQVSLVCGTNIYGSLSLPARRV